MRFLGIVLAVALVTSQASAQVVPPPAKGDREPVQHGAQPNPSEVRPSSPDGDAPSGAAGELVTKPGRRVLGLPIATALALGGVLIALVVVAGVVLPGVSRRRRARGGGTYGGDSTPHTRH